METLEMRLKDAQGESQVAALQIEKKGEEIHLHLGLEDGSSLHVQAQDYFHSLVNLRNLLAPEGKLLLCKGAQINVYPSRMSFQMGLGRNAYEMTLGTPADLDSLVDIFAPGDTGLLATPEQQLAFVQEWKESLSS